MGYGGLAGWAGAGGAGWVGPLARPNPVDRFLLFFSEFISSAKTIPENI
jgi:hypothetical protein